MTNSRTGIVAQGDLSEQSRQALLQSQGIDAVNLNEFSKGKNVPLIDHSTSEGFESNKGYGNSQGIVDHMMELQCSEEWGSSSSLSRLEKAAKFIDKHRQEIQEKSAWPNDLPKDAPVQDIKNYLRETTKIAVPNDKVPDPVANNETYSMLEKSMHDNPEIWNVDRTIEFATAVADRLKQVVARFVPTGQSSDQLKDHAERSVQPVSAGAEQGLSNLDHLAMPQPELAASSAEAGATSPAPALSVVPQQLSPMAPPLPTGPSNTGGLH